ncbi:MULTISPECIES: ABC transporter ATP-binding protein [unclassified Bradyrhizobium]|uniref:ABC transporter ATP-binding protein n=1 Tax=unclassified Bradyrhizobium TaxID=2631580 RepID=UPI00244AF31A|nr:MULTISPECIES: ABC transporter ATP-binding protein [unclassified Bradyrhizobium]MDH2346135.1 ABC transporter ATP-binding protein [Bradyrhizobium sp. SSUT77]MDH2350491.1 ABC transporter ATP-binding protein [Bradyrhizobium sp. SSUT112]
MTAGAEAAGADVLLAADGISVGYGRVDVIRNISLSIRRGQIVTIIGPNGAGKTTLLSGLMGRLAVRGRLSFFGETAIEQPSVETLVGRGVTLIPETRELFGSMSVEDNLLLGAFVRHRRGDRTYPSTLDEVYALLPRLKERHRQLASTLSGGERQMLAMGRALMSEPRLLMLDEPSLGLAPLITRDILRSVAELRDRGVSCLLVEQNARAALRIADYAYVMESGAIVLEGPAAEVAANSVVINAYLGVREPVS